MTICDSPVMEGPSKEVERFAASSLLLRQRHRKLAVVDANGQAFDEGRNRVLAIGADQLGERGKQARLGETVAVHAVMSCLGPGLVEIAECCLFLLVVGQGSTGGVEGHGRAHRVWSGK